MKQIINGKKYDTTTATEICVGFFGNFNCKKVTLYQKQNGEFFEHHELTEFGFREWIVPVSKAEAMDYAEQEMSVDYDDLEGFVAKQNKENKEFSNIHKVIAEENAKKQEEEYALAFADEVTECNKENIYLLLRHLNKINWGAWSLPKMSIGYSCNQYNCNGVTATTIILDKPIEYGDEMIDKFVYGAPHGHLSDYAQIRQWR